MTSMSALPAGHPNRKVLFTDAAYPTDVCQYYIMFSTDVNNVANFKMEINIEY